LSPTLALKLVDAGSSTSIGRSSTRAYPHRQRSARTNRHRQNGSLSPTTGLRTSALALTHYGFPSRLIAFQYSGEGFALLGKAIQITASQLAESMKTMVFEPLGMTRSSFVWETRFEDDAAVGTGKFGSARRTHPSARRARLSSLQTTANDYARFLDAIAQGTGLKPERGD
jgi:CubicO group peptidase (beta-lactamase class C family)